MQLRVFAESGSNIILFNDIEVTVLLKLIDQIISEFQLPNYTISERKIDHVYNLFKFIVGRIASTRNINTYKILFKNKKGENALNILLKEAVKQYYLLCTKQLEFMAPIQVIL